MGSTKRLLEQLDEMRDAAIAILVKARLRRRCAICGTLLDTYSDDIQYAYALGTILLKKKDPLVEPFGSPREMTDSVKAAFEERVPDQRGHSCLYDKYDKNDR